MKVRKAVIPVAGYGTRFLPYTKAVPKAMLPILNKPAIQVISEEVVKSGITDILFVVGYRSEVLEAHFAKSNRLDEVLLAGKKFALYDAVKYPETMARISFVEQKALNGTAKAVEIAENFVNNEPFAILFGDDVMYNDGAPLSVNWSNVLKRPAKAWSGVKKFRLKTCRSMPPSSTANKTATYIKSAVLSKNRRSKRLKAEFLRSEGTSLPPKFST